MDRSRRRFVPSSEGLEGRQLLSTTATPTVATSAVSPAGTAAVGNPAGATSPAAGTVEAKFRRIQNLPFFLGRLTDDNLVPQPTVANIQEDLRSLVGQLRRGSSSAASAFNLDLRKAQPYLKIRPQDAAALNRDFGRVLESAGARPEIVADLRKQMTDLVNFATTQRNSRIVATNDYALVLQVALESGRPLDPPTVPSLLGTDHNGNKGKVQLTRNAQPSLTGRHIAGTNIQILDAASGTVLGSAAVDPITETYTVPFAGKLPVGIYSVRVRAENAGFVSAASPKFTFEVVPTPASSR